MDYKNVLYAYSDKRIIIRKGAWGADYKTTEYDKISEVEVNVGPIGEKYGPGNLHFITGKDHKGKIISEIMYAIQEPYKVFKESEKVMLDIKSDLYYPNDLRPKTNKGFNTEYKPG